MSDPFVWTPELTKKLFELRFKNDWLFKNKKQPWHEFRKILLENGFPEEMTLNNVRKKWGYTYDSYRIAKQTKNKRWKYYKIFDKHFGKTEVLDKYETWNDEWRSKLITCVTEAKALNLDLYIMWKHVEKSLRCSDLPSDCCIQDVKCLWQHLKNTFNRKHRMRFRRGAPTDTSNWPLYNAMLCYHESFEPELLQRLEIEGAGLAEVTPGGRPRRLPRRDAGDCKDEEEFQWSKDITETFIQIRLQHDWLFREKKWVWNDLQAIMADEYGFPKTLSSRELCRKWASTFSDYQRALATNNTSWLYYNLFECYLGEGSFSFTPLKGWKEEWVFSLILARSALEPAFHEPQARDAEKHGWREVEKRMRSEGLPLDHSLFDIPEIWTHLLKTYRWKRKFAEKGMLTEQWPYYDAMTAHTALLRTFDMKPRAKQNKNRLRCIRVKEIDDFDAAAVDDDYDDDLKLFDLKKKLDLKPKTETSDGAMCRACNAEEGTYHVFEACDDQGINLAHKLRVIAGVEIDVMDALPKQICFNCLKELENSYSFRRKCQDADKELRNTDNRNIPRKEIKIELKLDGEGALEMTADEGDKSDFDPRAYDNECASENDIYVEIKPLIKREAKRRIFKKKRKQRKALYEYSKMCEICGKKTRNLKNHLDMHALGKAYACDVCDKRFKFKSGLTIHKAVHDPTPKKTCEVCGKTFHILAQYRRHYVYHANERNHACHTCGKRFNTIEILKVHMRMHTDERPFSCDECGKTFRTAGCVSRHRRIVHKKISKTTNNILINKDNT